jgi:hypothetical protein
MNIGYSTFKQAGKYHYEVREGNPLTGTLIAKGSDYESKKEASYEMNKAIKKIMRLIR